VVTLTITAKGQVTLKQELLKQAELVAVPVAVLCEFVWVLRRGHKKSIPDISDAIRRLMQSANIVMNRPAIKAGLSLLDAGGDFADGVIAYKGDWPGAEECVSFDSKAVSVLRSQGVAPAYCHNNQVRVKWQIARFEQDISQQRRLMGSLHRSYLRPDVSSHTVGRVSTWSNHECPD
jgi:predicted nucleic-acid-binding protein